MFQQMPPVRDFSLARGVSNTKGVEVTLEYAERVEMKILCEIKKTRRVISDWSPCRWAGSENREKRERERFPRAAANFTGRREREKWREINLDDIYRRKIGTLVKMRNEKRKERRAAHGKIIRKILYRGNARAIFITVCTDTVNNVLRVNAVALNLDDAT